MDLEALSKIVGPIAQIIPSKIRETVVLRTFGFLKVPMLFYVGPVVQEMTDHHCVVKVPLTRRTKNHLNSMYFGALAVGAECAGGVIAMRYIQETGSKVSLIFKDFQAEFLKRAEGDVHFTCEQTKAVKDLVYRAMETGERQNMLLHIVATVPSKLGAEPVARFKLTLSLKRRSQKNKN